MHQQHLARIRGLLQIVVLSLLTFLEGHAFAFVRLQVQIAIVNFEVVDDEVAS